MREERDKVWMAMGIVFVLALIGLISYAAWSERRRLDGLQRLRAYALHEHALRNILILGRVPTSIGMLSPDQYQLFGRNPYTGESELEPHSGRFGVAVDSQSSDWLRRPGAIRYQYVPSEVTDEGATDACYLITAYDRRGRPLLTLGSSLRGWPVKTV